VKRGMPANCVRIFQ